MVWRDPNAPRPEDVLEADFPDWPIEIEEERGGFILRYALKGNPVVEVRRTAPTNFEVLSHDYRQVFDTTEAGRPGASMMIPISRNLGFAGRSREEALARGKAALKRAWEDKLVSNAMARLGNETWAG